MYCVKRTNWLEKTASALHYLGVIVTELSVVIIFAFSALMLLLSACLFSVMPYSVKIGESKYRKKDEIHLSSRWYGNNSGVKIKRIRRLM